MPYVARPPKERLLAGIAVDAETGCWNWTRSKNWKGYGLFGMGQRPNSTQTKTVTAHRAAYELFVGPIPEGLDLDHLCRNRGCVNPAHLEPVTRKENLGRGLHRNRGRTHCIRGHELIPENIYVRKNGYRRCNVCHREAMRRRYRASG